MNNFYLDMDVIELTTKFLVHNWYKIKDDFVTLGYFRPAGRQFSSCERNAWNAKYIEALTRKHRFLFFIR